MIGLLISILISTYFVVGFALSFKLMPEILSSKNKKKLTLAGLAVVIIFLPSFAIFFTALAILLAVIFANEYLSKIDLTKERED